MRKTPLILAILAIHALPAFSQNPENRQTYFWDADSISQFLSSPVFLTVLFVGCGIAILITICSFATERHLMQRQSGDPVVEEDSPTSSDISLFRSDRPKPACRVLQHFASLAPPAGQ